MYKIIGVDGMEYGPVTAEQLRQWITEHRVNATTRVQVVGSTEWKTVGELPELASGPVGGVPPSLPPTRAPKTSGMAIAGLVMGIFALIQCCSFLFGILGIIFSSIGISQIKKCPGQLAGRGMAIAGLVTSIVGVAMHVILLLVYWTTIMAILAAHQ